MKQFKFKATIEATFGGGAYVLFPYDVKEEFGTRGQIPVKATFNGVPYRGSLVACGEPQHMLPVMKNIRAQIKKQPGDTVEVVVERDTAERTVDVPPEFATLMKNEKLLPFFETLSYTHRKEYVRWITEAKKEETRARRLEKAVEMLKSKVKTPG